MWQTMEKIDLPNESLKNSIKKQAVYTLDSNLMLKLSQVLSETSLSFEIPIYLLGLWINYFKDAHETTDKLTSFLQTNEHQLASSELSQIMKNLTENNRSLCRKLKDFESIFDYYLTSTKSFASQSTEKFRKSTLKNVENLKFIPVNLHLEQFLVERQAENRNEAVTYDFTSVGAFTTVHTNKPMFIKPVDLLMMNDKPFVFNKNRNSSTESSKTEEELIDSEILLMFFALKVYIQIGDDLKEFFTNWQQIDQTKLNKRIDSISMSLNHISKCLCRSYQHLIEQYAQLVRIEFKQEYFNLAEKMDYYSFKFDAFLIEYKFLSTQYATNANQLLVNEKLKSLNAKLISALIEFYSLVISDTVADKFEFVNMCASFSQSFSTLIASLDLKYNRNVNLNRTEMANLFAFHMNNGILMEVESMLSCFSTEHTMVYEHYNATKSLSNVLIHLPLNLLDLTVEQSTSKSALESCFSLGSLQLNIEQDGFHVYLYTHFGDSTTNPISVYPVLVNVGINEQAVSSNLFGNNLLQKFINSQSIMKLSSYFENARFYLSVNERKLDSLFERLKMDRSLMDNSRPIELLHKMAEICRLMYGIRVTNCKSGKDRTGVSVSLEQSLLLIRHHGLPVLMQQRILDDMRRYGTRIDVVRKNVGQSRYAFNKLRYFLLPQMYRPPIELCDDLET